MNIAVVLAGGVGQRMGSPVPKQFIEVSGKPILVHTLEVFQNNNDIAAIEIVCLESYIAQCEELVKKFSLNKVKWVTAGGETCQESIRNGVFELEGKVSDDDILMIAMSVSPLIDDFVISDSLEVCKKHGNAIAGAESIFNLSMVQENNGGERYSNDYLIKSSYVTLNMPWTFFFGKLLWAYKKAYNEGIGTSATSYAPTLMVDLGETLWFSRDTQKNKLKITTFDDVYLLEGYLNCSREDNESEEL